MTDPDRTPAAWSSAPQRQGITDLVRESVGDVRNLLIGRRSSRLDDSPQRLQPGGDHTGRRPVPAGELAAKDWALTGPVRGIRALLHAGVVRPLLISQVHLEVGGLEELDAAGRPLLMVANHASHLDIPLILGSLPSERRRRTAVAVIRGTALSSAWRAAASAMVFNTVPQGGEACRELLAAGWDVLLFGEPSRSPDGFVGDFATDAATLAIERRMPVVPVGVRGSFAAMPRGRNRPVLGWPGGGRSGPARRTRPRVSVRFGPVLAVADDESTDDLTIRINQAVKDLIVEDVTTWWESRRSPELAAGATPPSGSWRRIWAQSQSAEPGGQARRRKIWS